MLMHIGAFVVGLVVGAVTSLITHLLIVIGLFLYGVLSSSKGVGEKVAAVVVGLATAPFYVFTVYTIWGATADLPAMCLGFSIMFTFVSVASLIGVFRS